MVSRYLIESRSNRKIGGTAINSSYSSESLDRTFYVKLNFEMKQQNDGIRSQKD